MTLLCYSPFLTVNVSEINLSIWKFESFFLKLDLALELVDLVVFWRILQKKIVEFVFGGHVYFCFIRNLQYDQCMTSISNKQ